MSTWTYLVADLITGVIIDELPLTGVRLSKVLNGSGQIQAQLQLGDAKVTVHDPYSLTRPGRRCIYAVRDNQPWWGGIIWAADYDDDSKTVTLGGADFWSYFDHRKVLEALTLPAAPYYIAGLSKVYTQQDQNTIARGLVTLAQAHTGGNIGITVDSSLSGILRDRTYQGYDLDYVGQVLRDLTAVSDGPDILFDLGALDPTTGRPPRLMRVGTPRLGQEGSPHRWDLGGNLLSFNYASGAGVMATRAFAQGDGTERGTLIAVAENTTRYANGWPLLETDDIFDGVSQISTLQQHADTLLGGLSLPLVTPSLRVKTDLPGVSPSLGEFGAGDDGRMVIPAGHLFFPGGLDLAVRVIGITVTIDTDGQETVELSCRSVQEVS